MKLWKTIKIEELKKSESILFQNGFPCGNWNKEGVGILQIRPFNVTDLGEIDLSVTKYIETDKKIDNYILNEDDVIFNNTNSEELVGRAALWKNKINAVLSNHMTIVRVIDRTKLNSSFVGFFLHYQWLSGTAHKLCRRHVNQASIGLDKLYDLDFPDIDVSEQRNISQILTLIQTAIQKQEEIISITTKLKNALMQKLFTEGTKGEKQKETEIGLVPESWQVVELNKTGDVIYGIQAAVANNTKPIGTKILTNVNISLEGRIVLEKVRYYKLKSKRDFNTVLKQGDILFNWRSGSKEHVGKTAIFDLEGEYTHSSFILRIRPNEKVDNYFLFLYLFYLRATGYFVKQQTYSINAKFNKSAIDILPVALPSLEEQKIISTAIKTVNAKLDHHILKRETLMNLFKTMLHQLMTGEIRINNLQFGKAYKINEEEDKLSLAAEPSVKTVNL